jgi:hypothetical protein
VRGLAAEAKKDLIDQLHKMRRVTQGRVPPVAPTNLAQRRMT